MKPTIRQLFRRLLHTNPAPAVSAALPYTVVGKNNQLIVLEANGTRTTLNLTKEIFPGLTLTVYGDNNTIVLHKPIRLDGTHINIGLPSLPNHGAYIELHTSFHFLNNRIHITHGNNQYLSIGKNTTMYDCGLSLPEQGRCVIGSDCMFSNSVAIRCNDGHTVFDAKTGEILNYNTSEVKIGNHCWIGSKATILKKAQLGNNCIVAENSVVTKPFLEDGIVLAGNPARIKRTGVSWDRQSPSYYILNKRTPAPRHIIPRSCIPAIRVAFAG